MLLDNFGLKFRVIPANIEEYLPNKIRKIGTFVENLSFEKARDIAEKHKGLIIGADTLVALTGKVMGKPENKSDAIKMLQRLSGNTHKVYTGIAMIDSRTGKIYKTHEATKV